ncbi:MAG: flagellar motor switch phosphatase FliY [Clostridia bacterium]|jgi:flagellar motor switch protein FliN/FliY|nr:flagellar motor switch phosphatase FliY [Clostridia bacterium]
MADLLSQEEIDALLGGGGSDGAAAALTDSDKDVLGEIGNISMGTAATTLSSLLNNKVVITTPVVKDMKIDALAENYKDEKYVAIAIEYKDGLKGANFLVLKENDVKIIANLMTGGDGTNLDDELTDLHLSAISEAMNQMIGSSCTSMSSMLDRKIDINPPNAQKMDLANGDIKEILKFDTEELVEVCFKMQVGELIDSEIMQILPISFAKELVAAMQPAEQEAPATPESTVNEAVPEMAVPAAAQPQVREEQKPVQNVSAKPIAFESFGAQGAQTGAKSSIDIIKDVNLEVTVELGKTKKSIKEILNFGIGTIIELDKVSGEPIDILVNGKQIAKGEVVVVDENFAIRITEIEKPENRL